MLRPPSAVTADVVVLLLGQKWASRLVVKHIRFPHLVERTLGSAPRGDWPVDRWLRS
jgi:hypothetical protein